MIAAVAADASTPLATNSHRIKESGDQADLLVVVLQRIDAVDEREVGIEAIDRFGQHRVTETVHDVGELGEDGRVNRHIDVDEDIDARLNLPRELLEHKC